MENDSVLISELLSLEESLLKPNIRRSSEALVDLIADDFIEIGSSGRVYRKKDIIGTLNSEAAGNTTLLDFKVKLLSSEVALVIYKAVKTGSNVAEKQYSLRSSIWKLLGGSWKIAFHQGTITSNFNNK